jgi:PAS domain S-box-containing protein
MAMTSVDKSLTQPSIALHAMVLESASVPASLLSPVILNCYPGSVLTVTDDIEEAREKLAGVLFDLIILGLDPFDEGHPSMLQTLATAATAMPTVLILSQADEDLLHKRVPSVNFAWEIVHREGLTSLVLERRVYKAIANHQRHWELDHLQHAFQSSLIQYRSLFDEVPDLIFICDRSGCLLDVNASAERIFGVPKEAMLMQPIFDCFGMRREDFDRLSSAALGGQGPIKDLEIEFHPVASEPIYALIHLVRCQGGPLRPLQFQGVVKDISPHKRLEQRLLRSEDRYKTLYDMARISSSSLRLEDVVKRSLVLIHECCSSRGTLLLSNDAYEEMNLLEATDIPDAIRKRLRAEAPARLGQGVIGQLCIKSGIHRIENPAQDLEPSPLAEWCKGQPQCQLVAIPMGRGNPTLPTSILLMLIDADAVDRIDNELFGGLSKTLEMGMTNCFHYANSQEAQARYRDLWDHAPAFFISVLKGGTIIEINKTAIDALGYQPQDLIGKHFLSIVLEEDHAVFEEHHDSLMATGLSQDYELRLKRHEGDPIIVSFRSEPLTDRHGHRIGEKSVLHDITRDKVMEARLRDYADNLERMVLDRTTELTETMNFLNGILEGSTEYAIVAMDEKGTFLHFNRGAQILFNYDGQAMVGRQGLDALLILEDSPWTSLAELLATVDQKGVLVEEVSMQSSDQRQMIALLTINRLRMPTTNDLSYVAIIRDVTEQKEMEDLLKLYTENLQQVIEEKSRELDRQHIQIIQSSKLATLGEMATGIAHELNQPLSGIRTRAQLLIKSLQRGILKRDRIEQNQREVIQLIDRITNIIDHMRIFARQDQQKFSPFRLTQSIKGAMNLMGEQLRIHAIEVTMDMPQETPLVLGEPLQIEQVLLNLLSNARDALDLRAELERQRAREYHKLLTLRVRVASQKEIMLEVEDNGIGMNEETRSKIFDPFFTTKPVGRGTGLGLSISYGILTNHNGHMEVESQEERGTKFAITLPIWDGSDEVAQVVRREDVPL